MGYEHRCVHLAPVIFMKISRLFSRLFKKKNKKIKEKSIRYIRRGMHVRGTYYYSEALLKTLLVGERVKLIHEPDNPYDENAVMVFARGEKIGYVPREDNKVFVHAIKLNKNIDARITEIRTEKNKTVIIFDASFS